MRWAGRVTPPADARDAPPSAEETTSGRARPPVGSDRAPDRAEADLEATVARVLVVEDDDGTRLLLESRLRQAGHRVRVAASAPEAHAVMERAGTPEVLVTDMFMPGGSGLALVAALRADPVCADLPVVLLSGRALPADVEAGRTLRATYLTKPVSVPDLTAAVDAALGAAPAALEESVRRRLADLGDLDDPAERDLFAQVLTSFVDGVPVAVAAVERAAATEDATALEAAAHRLRGSASNVGAEPLARLCGGLEEGAAAGVLPEREARAALHREVALTCRVIGTLARELAADGTETYA